MAKTNNTPNYLTAEVIVAWHACDFGELHMALNLAPWNYSPLPVEVTALGVTQGLPPDHLLAHQVADWRDAQALQRELLEVAGWPDCRGVYEENLRKAEAWAGYCKLLVDHPERGGTGTGSDPCIAPAKAEGGKIAGCLPEKIARRAG
jgi:hypothetical protein